MAKKSKELDMNLYYMNDGQAQKERIREQNKLKKQNDEFDLETETVINMTNRNKIKKDQEIKQKFTNKERKRKKRNKRIKLVLKIILLIAVISGGIAFALTSPIFNIKEIKVINNNQVTSDTIVSLSELKTDQNIFKFYKSNVIEKIKENPYIESIEIKRKIPSTVEINVTERIPTYSIDYMGKYAIINNQGYILEITDDKKTFPVILGSKTAEQEMSTNQRLNDEDLEKLEDVLKIMSVAKDNNLSDKITNIDITDKNEYSIYLETEKKKVHLGDSSNLSNKMLYVIAILEQEKDNEGDIYVNGDLNNKFQPYFRQKV